jgi:acetylornithine deacetylase/succinyl-diaminopimelate desuccinylase-like protein
VSLIGPSDRGLLLELLALPTAGPLECGAGAPAPELWQAQRLYAEAAGRLGFEVVQHAAPPAGCVLRDDVPLPVRHAAAERADFLACQPSLVLGLGPAGAGRGRTVMFNVHLDTVAGLAPVSFDGVRFHGRGAIDAKGPAVALLAGLRQALRERPELAREARVLVQAVAGEEGGGLGTFGTRPLVEAGHHGRLNVFCEPTGGRAMTRCTAAMTARLSVHGQDAVDDRPAAGHNATVLLGHLAAHLAAALDPELDPADGQLCVAGLHTGALHNRVYGHGQLLLNLSYSSPAAACRLEQRVEDALADGLRSFTSAFGGSRRFARTAADAADIVRLEWLKRGLPALDPPSGPSRLAPLLARAGIPPWPAAEPGFTCDAIWTAGLPDADTLVLGPGHLAANRAHAEGEFADLAELDAFAGAVSRLLRAFLADAGPERASPVPAQPVRAAPSVPARPPVRPEPPVPAEPPVPPPPYATRRTPDAVAEPADRSQQPPRPGAGPGAGAGAGLRRPPRA